MLPTTVHMTRASIKWDKILQKRLFSGKNITRAALDFFREGGGGGNYGCCIFPIFFKGGHENWLANVDNYSICSLGGTKYNK